MSEIAVDVYYLSPDRNFLTVAVDCVIKKMLNEFYVITTFISLSDILDSNEALPDRFI